MSIPVPTVQQGTYAQRIAYNTTGLMFDTFWYQTNVGDDSSAIGYYRWNSGVWTYISTNAPYRTYNFGRLVVLNDNLNVVVDTDQDANINIVSGSGSTYKNSGLIFTHDYSLNTQYWSITKTANSQGNLQFNLISPNSTAANAIAVYLDGINGSLIAQNSLVAGAKFDLYTEVVPTQITADQNDYNPTNLSTTSTLLINSDAARNITGLAGGEQGRIMTITNTGSFAITLKNASASSAAANRFGIAADIVLAASGGGCTLRYDATNSLWRCVGKN